tara:strand:- start:310 stop:663 length:354 start_codon:yes stop_codon:yes gene_type:complete
MTTQMKSLENGGTSKLSEILTSLFSDLEYGLTFVLWDGTQIEVGRKVQPVKIHFSSMKILKKILLNPSAANFAEAYCDQLIDIEGDLFESIAAADCFDYLEISFMKKIIFGIKIWML